MTTEGSPDDVAILEWLGGRRRVAAFVLSEDPVWLGHLGEAIVRSLRHGTRLVDLHVWTSALPFRELAGEHRMGWVRRAEAILPHLGIRGGSRSLAVELERMFGDRIRARPRRELIAPPQGALAAAAAAVRAPDGISAQYLGRPVGWAVYGTLAALTASSSAADLVSTTKLDVMTHSYAAVFETTLEVLEASRPAAVLIFNGRLLHEWAVREASRHLGIPVIVVEVGHDASFLALYRESAHDRRDYARRVSLSWQSARGGRERAAEVGRRWFEARRVGPAGVNAFVARQTVGLVPARLSGRRRIVFYTSSSDELLSAGPEWLSPLGSQAEVLKQLVMRAERDQSIDLVIRMHPHTLMKNVRDQAWWAALSDDASSRGATVLLPDSPVDTYALADSADVVLSCGSTIGLEAAYWSKPSATLAPAMYDFLNVATRATSIDEAVALRLDADDLRRRQAVATRVGFYEATVGLELEYFHPCAPSYRFGSGSLARRGALQRAVPAWITKWRADSEAAARTGVRKSSSVF